jgi:two-component system sensor kinase FixL
VPTQHGDLPETKLIFCALGDVSQIHIVLGNLVRNGIDAMPDGGTPTVMADHRNGSVNIHVRDTGVGIEPSRVAQIMVPLYTTKARGMVLGLAITRAIVEKHGGSINVANAPGNGSEFTVRLRSHVCESDNPKPNA